MTQDRGELLALGRAGNKRAAARLISTVERGGEEAWSVLTQCWPMTGRAKVFGLTGPPGAGKSTLANSLVTCWREKGLRVGVIAIDPTSPFSGGAILGDRVRMSDLTLDEGVFIRSMGTRGQLGGLSPASAGAIHVLDACGYDLILVETVGVGQSEVSVMEQADLVLVVNVPGLGDDVQAIKAGILEIGDLFVVNKAAPARSAPPTSCAICSAWGRRASGICLSSWFRRSRARGSRSFAPRQSGSAGGWRTAVSWPAGGSCA